LLALLVGALVFGCYAGSADAAATVSCGTSASTLTITITGTTTAGSPVTVSVSSGDYVVSPDDASCDGVSVSSFPTVDLVQTSGNTNEYVVLDDSNGQLASFGSGCPVKFNEALAGPAGTLEVKGVASPHDQGDRTVGLQGTALILSEDAGCLIGSDVNLTSGVQTLVVDGEAGGGNELDLTDAPGTLTVDAAVSPGTVKGLTSGPATVDFTDEQSFIGSNSGATTFEPGASNLTFQGKTGGNVLDLSAVTTSSSTRGYVNLTGQPIGPVSPDTAQIGTETISFSGITSVTGASAGYTTFYPAATEATYTGQGTGNTLDMSFTSGSEATVNLTGATQQGIPANTLVLNAVSIGLADIANVVGLGGGGTTVFAAASTTSFEGNSGGNGLDLSALSTSSASPALVNLSGATQGTVAPGTVAFGTNTITLSGVTRVVGAVSGHTTFYAGASSATFTGQGSDNTLDLSALATSQSTRAVVNLSAGTVSGVQSDSVAVGAETITLAGITTVNGPAPGYTNFVAGAGDANFIGAGAGNVLDLSNLAGFTTLTAAMSGGSCGAGSGPVTTTGGSPNLADCVAGMDTIVGAAAVSTTFKPGLASVTLVGKSNSDTLDLSGEPAGSFSALTVAMSSASCGAGVGAITSTGGSPNIADCFSGIVTVKGASALPTTFAPDPTLTAAPSPVPVLVGQDANAGGSVVDLTGFTSPDSRGDAVSDLTVALNADSSARPGQVRAEVAEPAPQAVTFADFYGVDEVIGPTSIPTAFQPGTTTGVTLHNIPVAPQTIAFTSTPPAKPEVGQSYRPSATGGASGNPVVSIDPISTPGACSLSAGTVRFEKVGACVIDADQAGTGEYGAAARVQQALAIVAAPPRVSPAVKIGTGKLADVRGSVAIKLSCPAGETFCSGTVKVTIKRAVLGSKGFKLAGGSTKTLKVGLSKRQLKRLGKHGSLRVLVVVVARDKAGHVVTTTHTETLKLRR
jgi:hypothetical protein